MALTVAPQLTSPSPPAATRALDGQGGTCSMRTHTVPAIRAHKVRAGGDPLVMVTAYDAPGARQAHAAGVDLILVGDTLAMVVLGHEDRLQVGTDDIAHHVGAVRRGLRSSTAEGEPP